MTCGCMQTVKTPPSTCSCIQSNSSRQISSTALGGAPPFRYGSKLNWKCSQSSSSKHIGRSHRLASRPGPRGPARGGPVWGDGAADPRVERPVVVRHQARVVDESVRLHELERRAGEIG